MVTPAYYQYIIPGTKLCQATLGVEVLCCSATVVFSHANVVRGVIADPTRKAQILTLGYQLFVAISFTAPVVPG